MKWTLIALPLMMLASCQNKDYSADPMLEGFFPEDVGEVHKTHQFNELMAASGARADAMLFNFHFDGGKLNSLGEEKLSLMLKDDDTPSPITVYLNVEEKAKNAKSRRTAVVDFLKDKGLTEPQIEVVYGDNPEMRSPAAQHLSRLSKTETGTGGESGGAAKDSAGSASGQGSSPSGADQGLAGASAAGK